METDKTSLNQLRLASQLKLMSPLCHLSNGLIVPWNQCLVGINLQMAYLHLCVNIKLFLK